MLAGIYFTLHTDIRVSAIYAYGQPTYGSTAYTQWVADCIGPDLILRIVSSTDIIPWMNVGEFEARHAANVREVYFPDAYNPYYEVCYGDRDIRCSAGVDCSQKDWIHHSDYGGLRISRSLAMLAGSVKGERLRRVQLTQVMDK
jgi:hypothetical protein